MRKLLVILTAVVLVCFAGQQASADLEWVPIESAEPAGIDVQLVESTPARSVISFELTGYYLERINIEGREHSIIHLPGAFPLLETGMPALPKVNRRIAIPDNAHMSLRILESEFIEVATPPVAPSKGNLTRDIDPASVPYRFGSFYSKDTWYPSAFAEIGEPFIVRDLRGLSVQLVPFQYNHARETLRVLKRIVVEVEADGPGRVNVKHGAPGEAGMNHEFIQVYRNIFLNFSAALARYTPVDEPGRMVIITDDGFRAAVEPLFDWKVQRGLPVSLVNLSDVGSSTTAIRNYIQSLYDSPEGITYIVLVGDADQIPTLSGTAEGAASDPCYVKLEGSDHYPDAFISRISAGSTADVSTQVSKFVNYEKYPDTGAAADWYHKGVGIASSESGGGYTDRERADFLRNDLLGYTYTEVDQIYDPGARASDVTAALNDGRSILNYIGHGSGTSWGTTGFSNSNIPGLGNGNRLPFIVDVACQNGSFVWHNACFAETWLRAGTAEAPKGAVGMYAASTNAAWVPPCVMQAEITGLLVQDERNTLGGLSFNGVMAGLDAYPGYDGTQLMEQYNLFGDCSMMIRTDTPTVMNLDYSPVIILGVSTYEAVVDGVEGALVSISGGGVCYGSAYTNASGEAVITFEEPFLAPMEATLTVTAYNKVPAIETVNIIAPEGPYLLHEATVIDDTAGNADGAPNPGETVVMELELLNVGTETGTGITATLSTESPYATVLGAAADVEDIVSWGTGFSLAPHFSWTAAAGAADGTEVTFTLTWACDGAYAGEADFDVEICTEDDGDGYASCLGDCDDGNPDINPDATEICDGADNNCDGAIDEGFSDADGDGWAYCADCDESDPLTYPGAEELCDTLDNDCNGVPGPQEVDADGDDFMICENDCDDTNPDVNPDADEDRRNGIDDDCDGEIDEGGVCFIRVSTAD